MSIRIVEAEYRLLKAVRRYICECGIYIGKEREASIAKQSMENAWTKMYDSIEWLKEVERKKSVD